MSELSEQLRRANADGLSARSIARAAQALGFTLNHDTAARYLRGDHGRPDEQTLLAFSQVLQVPLATLRTAADLPAEQTEPYLPPPESSRLTRRQRRAVDEIIRVMLDSGTATSPVTELRPRQAPVDANADADADLGAVRRAARRGSAEPPQPGS